MRYLSLLSVFLLFLSLMGCNELSENVKLIPCELKGDMCGMDNVTYSACDVEDQGIVVQYAGACESATECVTATDCLEGFTCEESVIGVNVCVPDITCESNSDCFDGQVCEDGECNYICPELNCDLFACPNGFKLDQNGCPTCECVEFGCETNNDCEEGAECVELPCFQAPCPKECVVIADECNVDSDCTDPFPINCVGNWHCMEGQCVPKCEEHCPETGILCVPECPESGELPNGAPCQKGNFNIETCECEPIVCEPVTCELYCEFGFKLDENGCEICECNEVGCPSECIDDSDCREGEVCTPINCLTEEGVSGTVCMEMIEPECYQDSDCLEGQVCELLDCGFDEEGNEVDCAPYGVCVWIQECRSECNENMPCPEGQRCEYLYCLTDEGEPGSECVPNECEPVLCNLYCEFGFKVDENGCEYCECNEEPICPFECRSNLDCGEGEICTPLNCLTKEGISGTKCIENNNYCPHECDNDLDCENGESCEYLRCITEDGLAGTECVRDECEPVMCDLYCEFGFKVDENGCEYCECNENPNECPSECRTDIDCGEGYMCAFLDCLNSNGEPGAKCVPNECEPVMCDLYCEFGFKVDENGCEYCECNENPNECPSECNDNMPCPDGQRCEYLYCLTDEGEPGSECVPNECEPVMCDLYCEFGYIVDENGCEICECNEPHFCPSECRTDIDCEEGYICMDLDCMGENGEPGAECVESSNSCINECVSDSDCEDGLACKEVWCLTDEGIPGTYCVEEQNECISTCNSDFDCAVGQKCEYLDCLTANGTPGSQCVVDDEPSQCPHECDSDIDCGYNQVCEPVRCVDENGVTGSACVTYP